MTDYEEIREYENFYDNRESRKGPDKCESFVLCVVLIIWVGFLAWLIARWT